MSNEKEVTDVILFPYQKYVLANSDPTQNSCVGILTKLLIYIYNSVPHYCQREFLSFFNVLKATIKLRLVLKESKFSSRNDNSVDLTELIQALSLEKHLDVFEKSDHLKGFFTNSKYSENIRS